jgi:hypothetical protein
MAVRSYPVARLMWAAPLLLYVVAAGLLWAGVQQREAAEVGAEVRAEVVSLNVRERAEVTRGSVRLRYTPPAAAAPLERDVELPMSFLKELEGREGETIPLRVVAGSDQVVLGEHPRAQWILTFAFAAMALIGAVGLTWMIAAWNRYLGRHGDPSEGRTYAATS